MFIVNFHNSSVRTGTPEWTGWATRTFPLLLSSRVSMSLSVKVAFFASCHKGMFKLCSKQNLENENIYLADSVYLNRWTLHPNTCCGQLITQSYFYRLWFIYQHCVELVVMRFCMGILIWMQRIRYSNKIETYIYILSVDLNISNCSHQKGLCKMI